MRYWMRYWYRHWDQGQQEAGNKDEAAAELAPGREQMPPTVARLVWRDPAARTGRDAVPALPGGCKPSWAIVACWA